MIISLSIIIIITIKKKIITITVKTVIPLRF